MSFEGFRPGGRLVGVPSSFFSDVLPTIHDLAELKVTLHIMWRLLERRTLPRFIRASELDIDRLLLDSLAAAGPPLQELRRGLSMAVKRGVLLELALQRDGREEKLYLLNTEADRKAALRIQSKQIDLGQTIARVTEASDAPRPTIYALYEQNIGLLTPMIAEELKAAEQEYPVEWIEDAFRVAVAANRRSWRYISRILERWHAEGKNDGTTGSYSAGPSWEAYFGSPRREPARD